MKIAIEILSTNTEPSTTNIKAMQRTVVDYSRSGELKHQYDFYFYYGDHTYYTVYQSDNCYRVNLPYKETIYNTFEKGIHTLRSTPGYDWYIRINISCFLNLKLLDKVLEQFNEDTVYCNAINSYINDEHYYNDVYPRGDMMIFSAKTRDGILKYSDRYIRCDIADKNRLNIPHVDDTLFGLCLIDYFGPDYCSHLQMLKYNYLPEPKKQINMFSEYCIGSRVKTTPPGITYSGYSWEDNEYRRFDAEKMYVLQEKIKDIEYPDIDLNSLFDNTRESLFVSLSSQKIDVFNKYIQMKRKN